MWELEAISLRDSWGVSFVSYGAFLWDSSVHPVGPRSLSQQKRECSSTQGGRGRVSPLTAEERPSRRRLSGSTNIRGRHGMVSVASGFFQALGSLEGLPNVGGVAIGSHTGPSSQTLCPGQTILVLHSTHQSARVRTVSLNNHQWLPSLSEQHSDSSGQHTRPSFPTDHT